MAFSVITQLLIFYTFILSSFRRRLHPTSPLLGRESPFSRRDCFSSRLHSSQSAFLPSRRKMRGNSVEFFITYRIPVPLISDPLTYLPLKGNFNSFLASPPSSCHLASHVVVKYEWQPLSFLRHLPLSLRTLPSASISLYQLSSPCGEKW